MVLIKNPQLIGKRSSPNAHLALNTFLGELEKSQKSEQIIILEQGSFSLKTFKNFYPFKSLLA